MNHAPFIFTGYAALFDIRDAARDIIRPGAFARTLTCPQVPRVPLYWQHNPAMRIGWIEDAAEDERGLKVVAAIDNPEGAAAAALRSGKVTGLSFGYRARTFTRDEKGRELRDVDLFEVSLVTHPMQAQARVISMMEDAL